MRKPKRDMLAALAGGLSSATIERVMAEVLVACLSPLRDVPGGLTGGQSLKAIGQAMADADRATAATAGALLARTQAARVPKKRRPS